MKVPCYVRALQIDIVVAKRRLMRIGIIGRHPIPQHGFCGVLSLYEALWFSRLGDEVTLFLPFKNHAWFQFFRIRHGILRLDGLEKLGGNFTIEPVFLNDPKLPTQDVYIWQSTNVGEWGKLAKLARSRCTVFTKNHPKSIPQRRPLTLNKAVVHQFNAFDYIALALKEDLAAIEAESEFFQLVRHRVGYAPRGADPDLLNPSGKLSGPPVIGIDTPNRGADGGIEHYFWPLEQLRLRYPDLQVLSLGRPVGLRWSRRVRFGRFDTIYSKFFNRIWLYLTIDYGRSPQHIRGTIHRLDPKGWGRKAIYEVQNIEAQMSGAVLVGHKSNLIPELFAEGETAVLFPDFNNADDIANRMAQVIEHYSQYRDRTRAWAVANHSWEHCIRLWRNGLAELVMNGYRREEAPKVKMSLATS
jgi:glycosyltransferase involved in cell wall biosynthesis